MQQAQGCVKKFEHIRTSNPRCFGVPTSFKVKPRFDQLNVPIAKITPKKIVDAIRCFVKSVGRERLIHVLHDPSKSGENPSVFECHWLEPRNARVGTGLCTVQGGAERRRHTIQPYSPKLHEHKSRRLPNLVSEIPIALRPALAER